MNTWYHRTCCNIKSDYICIFVMFCVFYLNVLLMSITVIKCTQTKRDQYAMFAFIWGEHRKLWTRGKTISQGLTTWYSPHMKATTILLYRNYSKRFKTWLFCFVVDNKLIYRKYNYGTGLKITWIFNTLSVVRGCRPGNNLLSPSTLYMFGLYTVLFP